jgi:hypothetical protein
MRKPRHGFADEVVSVVVEADDDVAHVRTNASNAPSVPMMPTAQSQMMM